MSHAPESTKVIFFALIANLGIALAKFTGAFFTGSSAMFSEAVHSLVDTVNQILLLIGARRALKPPSEKHPLGYGAESYFWSFMVAILLFTLGGVFAVIEGTHKLKSGEPLESPWIALSILIASLILESLSFLACLKEIRATNTHGTLVQWYKKTTSAELLVVFTEDLAALLGLAVATATLLLAWTTGNSAWDGVGSILVGGILIVVAVLLSVEIRSLLIGESPSFDYRNQIEPLVKKHLPGGSILRFIAVQTGGGRVILSYKVHPGSSTDVASLIQAINAIEDEARKNHPEIHWQFVEPDYHP